VVCDAVDLPACMAAVQLPGQGPRSEHGRRFEMLWSVDPRVVRDASRVAQSLADEYAPEWRPAGLRVADDTPPHASPDLGRASELFNRMLGYLETNR
jgi:MerR family transcriptional regulator, light-induced transcriptional regulator